MSAHQQRVASAAPRAERDADEQSPTMTELLAACAAASAVSTPPDAAEEARVSKPSKPGKPSEPADASTEGRDAA